MNGVSFSNAICLQQVKVTQGASRAWNGAFLSFTSRIIFFCTVVGQFQLSDMTVISKKISENYILFIAKLEPYCNFHMICFVQGVLRS